MRGCDIEVRTVGATSLGPGPIKSRVGGLKLDTVCIRHYVGTTKKNSSLLSLPINIMTLRLNSRFVPSEAVTQAASAGSMLCLKLSSDPFGLVHDAQEVFTRDFLHILMAVTAVE